MGVAGDQQNTKFTYRPFTPIEFKCTIKNEGAHFLLNAPRPPKGEKAFKPVTMEIDYQDWIQQACVDRKYELTDLESAIDRTRQSITFEGRASFLYLKPDSYHVSASKIGYTTESATVELDSDKEITLRLLHPQQVIPEVPIGTVLTSAMMGIALLAYTAMHVRARKNDGAGIALLHWEMRPEVSGSLRFLYATAK